MVAIGLMFYGFVVQPVMSYGTVILFLYGLIASFVGLIRHKEYVWIYVLRLLVCFTIPVTNLLMYFATIGGDARKFDFQPMPLVYYLVFILEIMIIFLPEIFLLIEKSGASKRNSGYTQGRLLGCRSCFGARFDGKRTGQLSLFRLFF